VGRIDLKAHEIGLTPEQIKASSPFRLNYIFSAIALPHLQAHLVDRKETYGLELGRPCEVGIEVDVFDGKQPELIYQLGLSSGKYSRFATDPHFTTGEFEKLYRIWVEKSLNGQIADFILTAKVDGQVAGMVTLRKVNHNETNIGLIAVHQKCQGRGVGKALMHAAFNKAILAGATSLTVDTQGLNEAACALYKACEMRLLHTVYVYHLWAV